MPTAKQNNERRNYFRIDDDIVMTYRPIPQEQLPEAFKTLEETLNASSTLTASLTGISQRTAFLKKQIRQEFPVVADCLDILEDKLDMLARALLLRDRGVNEKDTREVNLSAGGIEFHADESFPPESALEMKFVIFPSRYTILTYGRVIRCEPNVADNPSPYKVAVEFVFIRETDRHLIIRHVLDRESGRLRQQRMHERNPGT